MIAGLVGTLAFVFQPDLQRVAPFARALRERLAPSDAVLADAGARIDRILEFQRERGGPDTRLELDW